MNKKFCSLLGFARKSGNVILGFDNIERNPLKAKLLVSACDSSARTKKNITLLNRPLIETDLTKSEMGRMLGCIEISVIGITDDNFAKQLKIYANTERE